MGRAQTAANLAGDDPGQKKERKMGARLDSRYGLVLEVCQYGGSRPLRGRWDPPRTPIGRPGTTDRHLRASRLSNQSAYAELAASQHEDDAVTH